VNITADLGQAGSTDTTMNIDVMIHILVIKFKLPNSINRKSACFPPTDRRKYLGWGRNKIHPMDIRTSYCGRTHHNNPGEQEMATYSTRSCFSGQRYSWSSQYCRIQMGSAKQLT